MAQSKNVLNRLQGKIVCLHGKFSHGVKDQLQAKAEAFGAKVVGDLDAKVDFLVLQDTSTGGGGVGIQKKALAFNAKGATIQIQSADDFNKTVVLTEADILALIRGGRWKANLLSTHYRRHSQTAPFYTFVNEKFDGLDLSAMHLAQIAFTHCSFVGANVAEANFDSVSHCDFSKCQGDNAFFDKVDGCTFIGATLAKASFDTIANADFTSAKMEGAGFNHYANIRGQKPAAPGLVFRNAMLKGDKFSHTSFASPDFQRADLTDAVMADGTFEDANFKEATLNGASLLRAKLKGSDFTKANLMSANLADADLQQATVTGADFTGANLRGATLSGTDMSKAKGVGPIAAGAVGPTLTELDTLATKARRIYATFKVHTGPGDEGDEIGVDSLSFKYGWGVKLPHSMMRQSVANPGQSFSDAMLQLANAMGHKKVRYETVDVQSTKSAKRGKDLRDLVLKAIEEAFAQPMPAEADLAAATKLYREADREKNAAAREEREKAKAAADKAKVAEVKKVEKKIEKAVGKVTDTATFLKALELRIEEAKISKATSMLKKSGFQLYNDVTAEFMSGVVKSQTDPDLVYACRIKSDGSYSCCTQNLNVCGGLRGSICKHLLVLIIGLVQAEKLDPNTIDGWVAKSNTTKPVLDKEIMGEIFIRYKGAEAGEVDWRPTETMPEDYYAL